jgi:hypothetical protein
MSQMLTDRTSKSSHLIAPHRTSSHLIAPDATSNIDHFTMVKLATAFLLIWQVQSWSLAPRRHSPDSARRDVLSALIVTPLVAQIFPAAASAVADEGAPDGLVTASGLADLLRAVPTFAIVDSKGVPFMVVGEDAKVTGYFFTTYGEANRLLSLAKTSADKAIRDAKADSKKGDSQEEEIGPNPWKSARISSVPLDFAVTLASKSTKGAYFRVAPAEEDIDDALAVIGKDSLPEGKIPLFYFADFDVQRNGKEQSPVYFRKSELLAAWKRENKGVEPPEVKVTELFSVLTEMVRPGGTDKDLIKLVFEPPVESEKKAKECNKASKEDPFQLGERIVVL